MFKAFFIRRLEIYYFFHILLIIVTCFLSTYFVYCDYKRIPKDNSAAAFITENFASIYPLRIYTRWTGIESGYGFFSPSVRSKGFIEVESCGLKIYPMLNTIESQNRFRGLSSEISDHLFNDGKKEFSKRELEENKIEEKYYNLIYKNITTKVLNQSGCKDRMAKINYTLIDYPPLERLGLNQNKISLFKLQEIEYETSK